MENYQIFISYRRDGGDALAGRFSDRLNAMGYKVFFDVESMRSGAFNTQILDAIEQCTDVLLILPPNALDRCVNENDWVRQEISFAIKHNKNVIPIMMRGFEFPEELPPDIEKIRYMEGVTASTEYFDAVVDRVKTLLESNANASFYSEPENNEYYAPAGFQNVGDYTPQDPSYSDSNLQGMPQDTSYQTGFQNMGGYTAPNPPYSDPNLQGMPQNASFPYQSAPVPQQKKKKGLKWWHILLIGLGCILIFSIISAVSGDDKETDKSDNNFVLDNNIQFNGDKKIEYTKGTLDSNGTYTNEWLGITIDMPDGYVNGNEEQYASFENGGNTDCGFYAVSIYGEIVSVMFEDVSSVFGITEKQYLDILAEQLKQENTYGIEYSYPDSYGTMTIAGEIYKSAHFGLTAFDGSEMTQSFYVLKKDGRMCGIFIMGNSADENDTMARSIKKLY